MTPMPTVPDVPLTGALLRGAFPPGYERDRLDPDLALGSRVWRLTQDGETERWAAEVAELRELTAAADDPEAALAAVLGPLLDDPDGPPDGVPWTELLDQLEALVELARTAPGTLTVLAPDDEVARPLRTSRFHPEPGVQDVAARAVAAAHGEEIQRWAADSRGAWRWHGYADTGRPVGVVTDLRTGRETEVTGAALVLEHRAGGTPRAVTVWPEVPLDAELRARYPDLASALGSWLAAAGESAWTGQQLLVRSTVGPARAAVREQLDRLLADHPDDAGLAAAVEAMGTHVRTGAVRPWLEMIRNRIGSPLRDEHGTPIDDYALGGWSR